MPVVVGFPAWEVPAVHMALWIIVALLAVFLPGIWLTIWACRFARRVWA